jgi:thioredoxin reductase
MGIRLLPQVDVVVVGGGPAGTSAALWLGRCRRTVLLVDAGRPRNARTRRTHGFPTRDGVPPRVLRRLARQELEAYPTVRTLRASVLSAGKGPGGFWVDLASGRRIHARAIVLATGVVDELPAVPGIAPLYGSSVFHCPYCDAYEFRDRRLAAYGAEAAGTALGLLTWSRSVVLFTDGAEPAHADRARLEAAGVSVVVTRVRRLTGRGTVLRGAVLETGEVVHCDALFFNEGQRKRARLAEDLGCDFTRGDAIETGEDTGTCVAGVYAVGDLTPNSQFLVVAAAEGARAAVAVNDRLAKEDLEARTAAAASPAAKARPA